MSLREALTLLMGKFALRDFVYQVREGIDLSELTEDQSTWDHPDVVLFGEVCDVLEREIASGPAVTPPAAPYEHTWSEWDHNPVLFGEYRECTSCSELEIR